MREHFGIIGFSKLHPRRAAACKLRQGLISCRNATNKLACFLNNGEICCEVGVQNVIGTESTHKGDHFTLHEASFCHSKLFTESNAHRGRSADDNDLIGVCDSRLHVRVFVDLGNAGGRTDVCALSTVDTDRTSFGLLEGICTVNTDFIRADLTALSALDAKIFFAADTWVIRFNRNPNR